MTRIDTRSFPSLVGDFDSLFKTLERQASNQSYPPHNLIKLGEYNYLLELAVAGYSVDDIEVVQEKNTLTIQTVEGYDPTSIGEEFEFIHRGLSAKRFRKQFTLGEHVEVSNVMLENGILTVRLTQNIPEEQKPKVFEINTSKRQLLTEG